MSKGFKKTFKQIDLNSKGKEAELDIFFVPQGLFESKLVNVKNQLESSHSQTTIYQKGYNSIICNSGSISIQSGFTRVVVEGKN